MADKRCRRHGTPGRTLHLIDIENLVRGSGATPAEVAGALAAYRAAVAIGPGDHVVIASGRRLLMAAGLAWPGARLLLGAGVDGADLALLDASPPAAVAAAYDRVVIGSGDGIFATRAAELRRAGVVVAVVSLATSLAVDLRVSAGLVRRLPATAPA
ncbi:MAG: NYN domain-containing protein [Acidimicrobiia bacterium]